MKSLKNRTLEDEANKVKSIKVTHEFCENCNDTMEFLFGSCNFCGEANDNTPINKGMENNGWIKIESDRHREPTEDVWVVNVNGNKQVFYHDALKYIGKSFTHYQPITKPQPPIF